MVHPGKQETIYQIIAEELREKYYPGAKLPSERDYALRLGVARRTLRFVLDRLTEERKIIRNTHGTFRCDGQTESHPSSVQKEPLTILLPCPDYLAVSGYSSTYTHQQMIQGAMRATVEYGTHVVTLPVSDTNDPDQINWLQLRHLQKDSLVMFSGSWFQKIFPLLTERKCRIAYIADDKNKGLYHCFQQPELSWISCRSHKLHNFLNPAAKQLYTDGARKILYFGSNVADVSLYGENAFHLACRELKLNYSNSLFQVYPAELTRPERLRILRRLYREHHFDGLILELNPCKEQETEFDFYEEAGIPVSVRMVTTPSDLLHQPKIVEYARICHLPILKPSYQMAKFLLSGEKNQIIQENRYEFPPAKEFIMETRFK